MEDTTSIRGCINEARVHFLRDVHELKDNFPDDQNLWQWAKNVKTLYEQAVAWATKGVDPTLSARRQQQFRAAQQHVFEQQLWTLCQPYVRTTAPQHTLCERVERFLPELFVFVAVPGFLLTTIWPSAVFARWL